MNQIRILLSELLAQHRVNRNQLANGTGYATLNDSYTGKWRPSLETLEAAIAGLTRRTGKPVELTDLLEVMHQPAPLHGYPDRPALSSGPKTFKLRPRGQCPKVQMPSEVLVARLRGRDNA